jgi:hypothetical protein
MNQTQLDGITKARILASIAEAQANKIPYRDDAAYLLHVCAAANLETLPDYAADSYADQHADKTVAELEQELAAAIDKAAENPAAPDLPTPTVAGVPTRVTMRQARLALLGAGLLDAVTTAVGKADKAAQIEWEYAGFVERNAGLVPAMASALGMTDEQIDALFVAAAAL